MRKIPDPEVLKAIEEMQNPPKRKRGRPKGSKDKVPRQKLGDKSGVSKARSALIDPKTGISVQNRGANTIALQRMGDERVSAFVQYHIDMMKMRQGVDRKNVPDLYNRFYIYLTYCAEHGIFPNNMNAYYAIGIERQDIDAWNRRVKGTEEQHEFARFIKEFFASIHEQAGAEGITNPILSIYWSKAHDGMSDQPKVEIEIKDPMGDRQNARQIAEKYADILPEEDG